MTDEELHDFRCELGEQMMNALCAVDEEFTVLLHDAARALTDMQAYLQRRNVAEPMASGMVLGLIWERLGHA